MALNTYMLEQFEYLANIMLDIKKLDVRDYTEELLFHKDKRISVKNLGVYL